jgi:type IX secretion system PorP/SprF family membrane protein
MFWNHYSVYNPAATATNNTYYAASSSRIQWTKINQRPLTQILLFDYKIAKLNSGIGVNYTYDQLGYQASNNINLNYAYHLHLNKDKILTAGLSFGYQKTNVDYAAFTALTLNDPNIPISRNFSFFNLGAGLLYQKPHLLIGASAAQLNQASEPNYKNVRHLYFCTVGTFNLNSKFQLKPAIYFRHTVSASLLEANIRTVYLKKYWIGSTFRVNNSLCFMAGIDVKEKYRISYSYDFFNNKLTTFGATHELGLVLMIK